MSRSIHVCSKHPSHDLSAAEPGGRSCPVCGAPIVDRMVESQPQDSVISVEPAPRGPAPAIACARVPAHDVSARASGATACPQPGCDGALIQLECAAAPMAHDVSARAPGATTCPVCGTGLVQPVCNAVASHSMATRGAGQTACPICGKPLTMRPYKLSNDPRPADIKPDEPSKDDVVIVERSSMLPWILVGVLVVVIIAGGAYFMMRPTKPVIIRLPPSRAEIGMDRPGLDYANFDVNGNWLDCQARCTPDAVCKAWTWVKAPSAAVKPHCWLKKGVPAQTANPNTVSGVK